MTKHPELYPPKLNINGTSANELIDQFINAGLAVQAAFRAVQQCAPHGRDYQTVEPAQYRLARQRHNLWLVQLDDMHVQIERIALDVIDQKGG